MRHIATNAGAEGSIVVAKVKEMKQDEGFNAATETYEDLVKAGVIDPAKVVRNALQNASSIASLLLTTEALVSEIPEEKKEPAGGGHNHGGGMGGMSLESPLLFTLQSALWLAPAGRGSGGRTDPGCARRAVLGCPAGRAGRWRATRRRRQTSRHLRYARIRAAAARRRADSARRPARAVLPDGQVGLLHRFRAVARPAAAVSGAGTTATSTSRPRSTIPARTRSHLRSATRRP